MKIEKNIIQKYTTLYTSIGTCFGLLYYLIFEKYFGLITSISLGMLIGYEKDKRLSKNIMIIKKIEAAKNSSNVLIYVNDKNQVEKHYIVTNKKFIEEEFVEGDRVSEEIDGSLVSLEIK